MLSDARLRYLIVAGLCAAVVNGVMIAGAALRVHYLASSLVAFAAAAVLGFVMHSRFTFSVATGLRSFIAYAGALLLNFPIWFLVMFVLCDLARTPVPVASVVDTLLLFGWNYLIARWTIGRAPTRETP
ncbi:MAG: GtrA family protein [Caulobacterales bacterium]